MVYRGSRQSGLLSMLLESLVGLDGRSPMLDGRKLRLVVVSSRKPKEVGCVLLAFLFRIRLMGF